MKNSIIIVFFFLLGIFFGYIELIPHNAVDGNLSFYALCCLMLCVGISLGRDPDFLKNIFKINPRFYLLPLATIIGTFLGCAIVCLLLRNRSFADILAVGSGFGYYSLSSLFITEYKGAELGTIALIANIIRELITLLLAPVIVKCFGPLASISVGGATTMDTTLPVIVRFSGKEFAVISVFHGVMLDVSVPFFVTLFCSI